MDTKKIVNQNCRYCNENHNLGLKNCLCGCHEQNRWFEKKDMTYVKSCACRFSDEDEEIGICEYLCPNHQEEFILQLYNSQQSLNKLMPTIHEMNEIDVESILDVEKDNNKCKWSKTRSKYNNNK